MSSLLKVLHKTLAVHLLPCQTQRSMYAAEVKWEKSWGGERMQHEVVWAALSRGSQKWDICSMTVVWNQAELCDNTLRTLLQFVPRGSQTPAATAEKPPEEGPTPCICSGWSENHRPCGWRRVCGGLLAACPQLSLGSFKAKSSPQSAESDT